MAHPADISCFSSEGGIIPDLDKESSANSLVIISIPNREDRGFIFFPSPLFSVGSSTGST